MRPDRSVQYKYLNPNLVAMVTQTTDQVKRMSYVIMYVLQIVHVLLLYS